MLGKGGQKLQGFVDDVWKKIADWFLKNKKLIGNLDAELKELIIKGKKHSIARICNPNLRIFSAL